MRIIFCCDPLNPRHPEPAYVREVDAARRLGIPFDLVDHDALTAGRVDDVVRRMEPIEGRVATVFRGWMLKPDRYEQLYRLVAARGRMLVNSPVQYEHCHHLPSSYEVIRERTPRSVWLPVSGEVSFDQVMELLAPFGNRPVVVKDYVKSQKHSWNEACYIPSAMDRMAVERVVRKFLELQADDLNVGLVFREFVEFEQVGQHPKSGMPLSREFRQFYLDGKPLLRFRYWDEGDYGDQDLPEEVFVDIAQRVQSRFFTMDVARRANGEWMIVELGDGQVAGLPDIADPEQLFDSLMGRLGG